MRKCMATLTNTLAYLGKMLNKIVIRFMISIIFQILLSFYWFYNKEGGGRAEETAVSNKLYRFIVQKEFFVRLLCVIV
jgi:hypothetical protein